MAVETVRFELVTPERFFAPEMGGLNVVPYMQIFTRHRVTITTMTRVRTLKRDYVRVSPIPDAQSVLCQLPLWLAHYNELHPHRALGYRSPREFINRLTQESLSGL